MSLIYCDGADAYASADLGLRYSLGANALGNVTVQSAVARSGGQALRVVYHTALTLFERWVGRSLPPGASWVIGVAVRFTVAPGAARALLTLYDGGSIQCDLRLNPDGTLSVTRAGTALTGGTSATALLPNVWYYVEWKVTIADSIAANSCKVRLNGVDIITVATGQDTKATANAQATQLLLGQVTSSTSTTLTVYFDDLYICNQAGSVNNNFLGDSQVLTLLPDGNGTTSDLVNSDGNSTDNYTYVDDTTPDADATFVEGDVPGQADTYTYPALPGSVTVVHGVQVSPVARKVGAGARGLIPLVRSGGVDYQGAELPLADDYTSLPQVWETDPDTAAAWDPAAVDAAEFGYEIGP